MAKKYFVCQNAADTYLIHFGKSGDSIPILGIFPDDCPGDQKELADRIAKTLNEPQKKPASWPTDAKKLRKMIHQNVKALMQTTPLISEAIEDDDIKFTLTNISNAESQLAGLKQMLAHAKSLKINLIE